MLLAGHTKRVSCLGWSADGSWLASGSGDGTVRLWRYEASGAQGREVKVLRTASDGSGSGGVAGAGGVGVEALCWNPVERHQLITAGVDNVVRFWDTRPPGGRVDQSLPIPDGVISMAWNVAGDLLGVGTRTDELIIVSVQDAGGKASIVARTRCAGDVATVPAQLNEFAWTPTGLLLAAAGNSGAALEDGLVVVLRVSRDGRSIEQLGVLRGHTANANALKFHPTYDYFATAASDSMVYLWDPITLSVVRSFDRLETLIRGLAFSHDGTLIATASDDKLLPVMRVADGSRVCAFPVPGSVNAVTFAPHALLLAYACEDATAGGTAPAGGAAGGEVHAVRVVSGV